jgi:hypothetical protein
MPFPWILMVTWAVNIQHWLMLFPTRFLIPQFSSTTLLQQRHGRRMGKGMTFPSCSQDSLI